MMLGATDIDAIAIARAASTAKSVDDEGKPDAASGRFLPGNRAWAARASSGPAPRFADAESLWTACVEYFKWVEDNPLHEVQLVTYQGRATQVPITKMRAMTKRGLCLFLGIERTTWSAWKKHRPDLARTIEDVESVIWEWKFAGAAAGLLDASIVARELGLADRAEQGRAR